MYPFYKTVVTRQFARLPTELRLDRSNDVSRYLGHSVDSFLEGPSFDRCGNLYCVDIPYGRIFKVDPLGHFEVFVEYDGLPNGLKIHKDGTLFVADRKNGIITVDPVSRAVSRILPTINLEPFRGLNDLVFSPEGDLYFTDQGASDVALPSGRVYRLRSDGAVEVILNELPGPNGIALHPSGRVLYVALTRANTILRASIGPSGDLSRVQTYIHLSGGGGPDGIAVDCDGGLAVAHPMLGAVWLFDDKGEPTTRLNLCEGMHGTNLAFGGPNNSDLYITESETGTIQVAEVSRRGAALFSHMGGDETVE